MRPVPRSSRLLRWIAPCLGLLVCSTVALAQCTTTITGTVYSPLGPPGVGVTTSGDPIPNILVYVPQTPSQLTPFPQGTQSLGCALQPNLVQGNPLVSATSDPAGNFSLITTGITTSGIYDIVIQAGKWRRQYPNTQITACSSNNNVNTQYSGGLAMPASQQQGDLPRIAVVTGSADGIECIFKQIGIATGTEVTPSSGTGSINLFPGSYSPGQKASATDTADTEASLLENPTTLNSYDVVIFGCQGGAGEGTSTSATIGLANPKTTQGAADLANLVNFANYGGRIFATHYEYVWLNSVQPFESTATWLNGTEPYTSTGTVPALIDTSYPEGAILAQWLGNVGALYAGTTNEIGLAEVRQDTSGVNNPPAQTWVNLINVSGQPSMQFTFNTPVGASSTPTVAATYVNNTTLFQPGDTADSITVVVTNNSQAATTAGLTLTISLPGGFTATSLTDPTGTWSCNAATLICIEPVPLAPGAVDSVNLIFGISSAEPVGSTNLTASLSGGGISDTGQCGRVLYNDYHVENGSTNVAYPAECSTAALSPQEKFLEFSLYNLSNFVAPTSSDVIVVEGTPVLTWPTPAAISYGTPLSGTQLDATASSGGSSLSGTYAYMPSLGAILPVGNNPVTNTLSVLFTPTNTVNYTTATATVVQVVTQDTTSVVLTSGTNPSYLGQSVTFTAQVSTNGAIAAGQTVNFFDGLTQIGTGTTNAQGAATVSTAALIVGTHNMTACVIATTDFGASCSPSLIQLVTLIPTPPLTTSAVLTSNANPASLGQNVTFTVGVATTGAFFTIPVGTVTFYDGTTVLGTGTLSAAGFAAFSTSTLALGTHTITAVYGGSATLATATSNVVLELILTTLPSAGTGFLLTVDPTTLSMGVGESKILNVSVLSLNNYQVPINLTCTGGPSESACTFAKAAMPIGGGVTTVTFGVAAPHACGASTPFFVASGGMKRSAPFLAAGLFGLLFVGRRKKLRRLTQGLSLALALCLLPMLGGCGGTCTDFGTQPGNYVFTITATPASGTVAAQSQTINVNVHL